jgi:predicted RNA polymerase sigma factor
VEGLPRLRPRRRLPDFIEGCAATPVLDLNRAVAVSMAQGPGPALQIVDQLGQGGALSGSHLLPSVRGELLSRLGRTDEARSELLVAASLVANDQQRKVLMDKAAAL